MKLQPRGWLNLATDHCLVNHYGDHALLTATLKRSENGLLTPDNCVLAMIDLQPQMLFGVSSFGRGSIINNNVMQ